MKKVFSVAAGISAAVATVSGVAAVGARPRSAPHTELVSGRVARSDGSGPTPILVELFTSEGCSDCPSADTVLANLTQKQSVSGAHVIALGEHVDYWNNGSWADPYSSAAFSQRQSAYATAFRNAQVYTPQMVVAGHAEFVGSDADRATGEIRRAAGASARSTARVTLEARPSGTDKITVTVAVRGLPANAARADVYLALTEDGLSSQVRGGENRGRHLLHAAVARELERVGTISAGGGPSTFTGTLPLTRSASLANLHAVAFVQRAGAGEILGAADASLGVLGR